MAKDLYAVLGVSKDASQDDIRKAYRTLARKLHPDLRPDDEAAEQRFKEVSQAHGVLSDPDKRKLYDEFGEGGLREGFNADQARAYSQWNQGGRPGGPFGSGGPTNVNMDGDMSDILSQLFGGGRPRSGGPGRGGRSPFGPSKGADIEAALALDFLDAVRGSERVLTVRVPTDSGGEETQQLKVRIPPGADDGSRIRLRGKGRPGSGGGPKGDLLIGLKVRAHPHLTRDGKNLEMEVPITVGEAIQGAKITVPTLDGQVTVTVPSGSQNGQKMRLKGKGVPSRKGEAGDLYLVLKVTLPDQPSEALSALSEQLDAHYSGDVRGDLSI